jgi:CARDB
MVLAVLVVAGGGAGLAAAATASSPPRASLQGFICQRGSDPPARGIAVQAVMRPVSATKHMELRFELFSRPRVGAAFTAVPGGDLGAWLKPSNPTLGQRPGDKWILNKQVVNLGGPAYYRFKVTFRWLGSRDRVLGTDVRSSAICFEPAPDLVVKSIAVTSPAANPQAYRFRAMIANEGGIAADQFTVQFVDGGAQPQTRTVQRLGAHKSVTVKPAFRGACSTAQTGQAPTVTVRPAPGEGASNSMTAVCPSSTG